MGILDKGFPCSVSNRYLSEFPMNGSEWLWQKV